MSNEYLIKRCPLIGPAVEYGTAQGESPLEAGLAYFDWKIPDNLSGWLIVAGPVPDWSGPAMLPSEQFLIADGQLAGEV